MSTRSPRNGIPSASSSRALALALRERAVGAHDPVPRHARVVAGEQHGAGEARRAGRHVAVGAHEPRRRVAHAVEHAGGAVHHREYRAAPMPAAARHLLDRRARPRHRASSAPRCSRTGSPSARSARGRGPGVGAVATQSVVEPAHGPHALDRLAARRGRRRGARGRARGRRAGGGAPGRRRRRARPRRRPHRRRLHPGGRPRDRRALDLPGEHDGPRHRARTRCRPRSRPPAATSPSG